MIIPKSLTVGFTKYSIEQPETLTRYRQGLIEYGTHTISIAKKSTVTGAYSPVEREDTFWHELTHAVLHDMEHPLPNNEEFVIRFSTRLSKAIRTARF